MTATNLTGPLNTFFDGVGANPDLAPNIFWGGHGMLLDPRLPFSVQAGQGPFRGWFGGQYVSVDAVPSSAAANNIVASQSPGTGAITLVTTSAAGVTVGNSIVNSLTGATVTGLLAIDSNSLVPLAFGQTGVNNAWDPTKMIMRCLSIAASTGVNSGVTFVINGFDAYGFPMTQSLAGPATSGTNAVTTKAFKFISSITHNSTVTGAITIGTTDTYGLPLRADSFGYLTVFNGANTASQMSVNGTGFVAAVTTSASATTGDVRGTYAMQGTAPTGTSRITIIQNISAANVGLVSSAGYPIGLIGVAQA